MTLHINEKTIEYIKNNRNKKTIKEIASIAGLKVSSVKTICKKYNIYKDKDFLSGLFTKQEIKVVKLICKQGIVDNKNLLKKMNISIGTLNTFLQNIFSKTGCNNKTELIFKYYNNDINSLFYLEE